MDNYIDSGMSVEHTLGGTIATSGVVKISDTMIGVAAKGGASGDVITVFIQGKFLLPKVAGVAFTIGLPLYWDEADGNVQADADAGTNKLIGYAAAAAGSGDTTALVILSRP